MRFIWYCIILVILSYGVKVHTDFYYQQIYAHIVATIFAQKR